MRKRGGGGGGGVVVVTELIAEINWIKMIIFGHFKTIAEILIDLSTLIDALKVILVYA